MIVFTFFLVLEPASLTLCDASFDGQITRLEIWKQIISEQQLLGSYRDCRKQNGDIFSWSHLSDQVVLDTAKLKSSSFCSGRKSLLARTTCIIVMMH